ncbi:MAG TPA: alpha/beta hydrolase [Burkholderiaceae bacterium]|nr:alpha/beta hydrolase [Burkholderiaceae bacterium]
MHKSVTTSRLQVAYLERGPDSGPPVILLHGWPSDVQDWDEVAHGLADEGFRVLIPWLRGFGPTRFLDAATPRSGQQGALGDDLREFMQALAIDRALLAGYDWGGRAACVVSALWPQRVAGLLTITGYNIQDIAQSAVTPADPAQEQRYWYQWYFHAARGREALLRDRRSVARYLWHSWSPNWDFDEACFARTASSFDNPDFVDVTIHSYRHRYAVAPGDPHYDDVERKLSPLPRIDVPTIVLHGACDGVIPPSASWDARERFGRLVERREVAVAGHFLSREAPRAAIEAIRALHAQENAA